MNNFKKILILNVIVICGSGNLYSLDKIRVGGISILINTTNQCVSLPRIFCLNLEHGSNLGRKIKLIFIVLCLKIMALLNIPVNLYAPHLANVYSNYVAFKLNLKKCIIHMTAS
jgi:hypothetical protein